MQYHELIASYLDYPHNWHHRFFDECADSGGKERNMTITLTLPKWMVERIVAILDNDPYTGAKEIIDTIRKQVEF